MRNSLILFHFYICKLYLSEFLITMEVTSGCCSICFDRISGTEKGVQCKECMRRFHILCARSDTRTLRSRNAEFTCNQCATSIQNKNLLDSMNARLENLKDIPSKLDRIIVDYDGFKATVNNELIELKAKQNIIEEKHDTLSKRTSNFNKWDYKHDLLISGIPSSFRSESLTELVIKIAAINKLNITIRDLIYCMRLKNGNVLVKFVSILVKDAIMTCYFKTKNLILSQITDLNIGSRIYLNNNYPKSSQRAMVYCRKLKKADLVKRYSINHIDGSISIVNMDDSQIRFITIDELVEAVPVPNLTNGGS